MLFYDIKRIWRHFFLFKYWFFYFLCFVYFVGVYGSSSSSFVFELYSLFFSITSSILNSYVVLNYLSNFTFLWNLLSFWDPFGFIPKTFSLLLTSVCFSSGSTMFWNSKFLLISSIKLASSFETSFEPFFSRTGEI